MSVQTFAAPQAPLSSGPGRASLSGRAVLIVEDEMFIACDIAYGVEDAGGSVVGPASTVEDALALLATHEIHGAILDVNLLDGDVTPVLQRLVRDGVAVIVNTGTARPWDMERHYPFVPVFTKPTEPETLAEALAGQIDGAPVR